MRSGAELQGTAAELMLAEVDENLAREELGTVDFAIHIRARELAFLELKSARYTEESGKPQKFETLADLQRYEAGLATRKSFASTEPQLAAPYSRPKSFIQDTAEKSGKSSDVIFKAKKRADTAPSKT